MYQYRKNKKIRAKQFAAYLGISPSYLSSLENGSRSAPPFKMLESIADKLDFSAEERQRFYDLAAESKMPPAVADDIVAYMYQNPSIREILRYSMKQHMKNEDWELVFEFVKMNYYR